MVFKPEIRPHVIASHLRYSEHISSMMAPDLKKIAIVRDPYFQFTSIFDYFHHIGVFKNLPIGEIGLKSFFEKPDIHFKNDTRWGYWLAKNVNFFDLGKSNLIEDEEVIAKEIEEIFQDFDFFMISDYMIESLILLKWKLCLKFDDIIFFSMNSRSNVTVTKNAEIETRVAIYSSFQKIKKNSF